MKQQLTWTRSKLDAQVENVKTWQMIYVIRFVRCWSQWDSDDCCGIDMMVMKMMMVILITMMMVIMMIVNDDIINNNTE